MFTEQKPPCAAKLGVPNCAAQKPVSAWLWSRPVKKARRLRVGLAHAAQPAGRGLQRLVPGDLPELARAALAHALQRRPEPRRRVLRHDAGRALAAEHALVHRVVRVALDVADAAVLQVDFDAAAAGAHVAGGALHRRRRPAANIAPAGRREAGRRWRATAASALPASSGSEGHGVELRTRRGRKQFPSTAGALPAAPAAAKGSGAPAPGRRRRSGRGKAPSSREDAPHVPPDQRHAEPLRAQGAHRLGGEGHSVRAADGGALGLHHRDPPLQPAGEAAGAGAAGRARHLRIALHPGVAGSEAPGAAAPAAGRPHGRGSRRPAGGGDRGRHLRRAAC